MTERLLLEYALNASWQLPLLAAAAWLFTRAACLAPLAEHRLWLVVLALCIVFPSMHLDAASRTIVNPPHLAPKIWVREGPRLPSRQAHAAHQPDLLQLSPAPTNHRDRMELHVTPRALHILSALYASIVALALLRFARNVLAAHRLLTASEQYAMAKSDEILWRELTRTLQVSLSLARVRTSLQISSPVVIGAFKPALLLPPAFGACAEPERRAALCHELAHIRRGDCLIHAACELGAVPLVWHPVFHLLKMQIARTREMTCDLLAARHMPSEAAYARSLLLLAQTLFHHQLPANPASAMGLFRSKTLEERVIRLTAPVRPITSAQLWARRAIGTGVFAASLTAVGAIHVKPVLAQNSASAAPIPLSSSADSPTQTATPRPPEPASPPVVEPQAPAPAAVPIVRTPQPDREGGNAIAHGRDAHILVPDGRHDQHVHRWIGADGQPFEMADTNPADLTPEQQREAEADWRQQLKAAQKELADLRFKLDSPEYKAEMQFKFDSPEFKAEMNRLSSLEFLKAAEQSQKAIVEMQRKLNSPRFKTEMNRLSSPEMEKQLALAAQQAALISSPDFEKRLTDAEARMDAATKRLEEASKALQEAQREIQSAQPR